MEGLNQFFQSRGAEMWIALAFLLLMLEVWVFILHRRINRLQAGAGARPDATAPLPADQREALEQIRAVLQTSLQKVGVVRFNPFGDTGGDQSFALVLADADGNGLVMSCLHRRNESKVYAKPLSAWQSKYALSAEEQQAMSIARGEAASQ